ncbi:unnamed protein product, partial [Symbiodinium sp. CCMP2592]
MLDLQLEEFLRNAACRSFRMICWGFPGMACTWLQASGTPFLGGLPLWEKIRQEEPVLDEGCLGESWDSWGKGGGGRGGGYPMLLGARCAFNPKASYAYPKTTSHDCFGRIWQAAAPRLSTQNGARGQRQVDGSVMPERDVS